MTNINSTRIDEISQYYAPINQIGDINTLFFWGNALLSLVMPYSTSVFGKSCSDVLQAFFLVLVLTYFILSQVSSLYLIPRAERMRRRQMLSDSFGAALSLDRTALYYNNSYAPSVERLGANTMENALFSKEITARMLERKRIVISGYLFIWLFAFSLRHDNLEVLTWITQLVFSSEILTEWIKLEILRSRFEQTFDDLHSHFLHKLGHRTPCAIANILDAFVSYESAKSTAGILLSTTDFQNLNPALSKKWQQICQELDMHDIPESLS